MATVNINPRNIQISEHELLGLIKDKLQLPDTGLTIIDGKLYEIQNVDDKGNFVLRPKYKKASQRMIDDFEAYNKIHKALMNE